MSLTLLPVSRRFFLHAIKPYKFSGHDDIDLWTTATLDYSAANEYIQAHYKDSNLPWQQQQTEEGNYEYSGLYFQRGVGTGNSASEPIYNARRLPKQRRCDLMKKYGMTLIDLDSSFSESAPPTKMIMDWRNMTQIKDIYLTQLEEILPSLFQSKIMMHCFWNPMLRGERHSISDRTMEITNRDDDTAMLIPTSSIAPMVHIDTDVGAYESLDDLLSLVDKNRVRGTMFDREEFKKEILDGKRFVIINFWRSTNPHELVTSAPLAILSTRYTVDRDVEEEGNGDDGEISISSESTRSRSLAFPNASPDMEKSRWYAFPNMTNSEVLVFYQYDRLVTQTSDLWHCAISLDGTSRDTSECGDGDPSSLSPPRESFDIRVMVVLDENVPEEFDRFHLKRTRPLLTLEESGCFCDEQALKRNQPVREEGR